MAIEIVPKEKIKGIKREDILFYLSLSLLVIALLAFVFFIYYEKKSLETIRELDDALARQKTKERTELAQRVFAAKKKIDKISLLLSNHKKNSNVFGFLEGVTHPKAFFSSFGLDADKRSLSLEGKTESFKTLGQQIIIFKQEEPMKEINLLRTGMGREGEVSFSFGILLGPEILKYK